MNLWLYVCRLFWHRPGQYWDYIRGEPMNTIWGASCSRCGTYLHLARSRSVGGIEITEAH